ncbi:MAG: hypothetical protein PHO08_19555 [Methylococcales bacterium]|nr:hypothetical protein [Methylococcales bacterium]MDD5632992.1 hypothetical protein [Methylococcales bacterium]
MTERISIGYKPLFEVRLLHHYWLDEGGTVFDLIQDQVKKDTRLRDYDRRSFLSVMPTGTTTRTLKGLKCIYKDTAFGFIVAVQNEKVIPSDALFEFVVTIESSAFFNYTALTLQSRKIHELYDKTADKTWRYKENVSVLSNLTGASRVTGVNKSLFLSKEYAELTDDDSVESLVISGGALWQLTGDQPGAGSQQLNALATNCPVFVHQGDVPVIVPPADLIDVPKRGIMLSDDIPDDVFALIRLSAVRANDSDFSFIDDNGRAKTPHPIFQIRLKNRSTIWQYLNKKTNTVTSTELNPLPLTHFGNAGTKQKPSEGWVKAEKNGTKITRIVSEIFV